jgi:hypothetical protein
LELLVVIEIHFRRDVGQIQNDGHAKEADAADDQEDRHARTPIWKMRGDVFAIP